MTSPDIPQANGLTERAVRTFKRCVRTYVEASDRLDSWDDDLPYIQLGYNSAVQASSKFSLVQVLFGRSPTIPPATRERLVAPLLDVGSDAAVLDALMLRVEAIKHMGVQVGDNLRIAQHRDSLRYARKRSGEYSPMLRKFEEGDYVYVRAHAASRRNLDSHTHHIVRRVIRVGATGTLKVQAPDGSTSYVHAVNAAPCHVPSEHWPLLVSNMRQGHLDQACMGCNHTDSANTMLLCDACGKGWHMACLSVPLLVLHGQSVEWRCEACVLVNNPVQWGVGQTSGGEQSRGKRTNAARRKAAAVHPLEGRFVCMSFAVDGVNQLFWGVVHCRGAAQDCKGRENFQVDFEDGEQVTYTENKIRRFLVKEGIVLPIDRAVPSSLLLSVPLVSTAMLPLPVALPWAVACCWVMLGLVFLAGINAVGGWLVGVGKFFFL